MTARQGTQPTDRRPLVRALARVGGRSSRGVAELGLWLAQFAGAASARAVTDVVLRLRYRRVVLAQVSDIVVGVGGYVVGGGLIFVVVALSLFSGAEVGLQGYQGLQQIGAESFTGLVASFANVREVTPVIAGVAFAAQVGTMFTAEIGAMRINEEIDALEVIGVPSLVYLVSTRLVATLIALVPMFLLALFGSFLASRLIATTFFGLSPGVYDYYFNLYLPPIDVLYSLIKVVVFAVVVALVHCYYGYYASGGPAGVGIAVGRAVRMSIIAIVVINLLLSFLFWGTGSTVSLTG